MLLRHLLPVLQSMWTAVCLHFVGLLSTFIHDFVQDSLYSLSSGKKHQHKTKAENQCTIRRQLLLKYISRLPTQRNTLLKLIAVIYWLVLGISISVFIHVIDRDRSDGYCNHAKILIAREWYEKIISNKGETIIFRENTDIVATVFEVRVIVVIIKHNTVIWNAIKVIKVAKFMLLQAVIQQQELAYSRKLQIIN